MKIFIAVPCMEQVQALFAQCLAMLRRDADCMVSFQVGSLVYDARNKLANEAIRNECDYVFWVDSDMTFRPDTLIRMLKEVQEKKIDFLAGLYFRRKPPYSTVMYDKLEPLPDGSGCTYTLLESIPEGTFEVGGVGLAGVLMSTDVLMSVAAKYGGRMFDPVHGMGEDLAFCWKARQCGYKIFVDSGIEFGHVGQAVITRAYFEAFREEKEDAGESKARTETDDDGV